MSVKKISILLPAMLLPFLSSIFYFDIFAGHWIAAVLYAATKVFTLVWPMLGSYFLYKYFLPRFSLLDGDHRAAIPLGVLSGIAISILMFICLYSPIGLVFENNITAIKSKVIEMGIWNYYIPFAIFLSFFHSLLEEFYWRFFIFGNLREDLGLFTAALCSSIAFASHHVIVLNQYFPFYWALFFGFSVGVGGFIWCYLYEFQKSLIGAWISHMLVDIAALTIGYLYLFL